MKKCVFGILNYLLPQQGVLPMHCSANIGPDGKSAVFFGLSGTGKTTLSADASRTLIGDDEHGWSDTAVFNFEGGCYAKMIRLSAEARAGDLRDHQDVRHGARERGRWTGDARARLRRRRSTENTRGAYPIDFIPNAGEKNLGPVAANFMLTADAFGVLPRSRS